MEPENQYVIRPRHVGDDALIYGTLLQGHFEKSLWAKGMEWVTYKAMHRLLLDGLLKRASCLVACAPDYQEQIFGYVIYEAPGDRIGVPVLHWTFVKGPFKRNGIGTRLMAEAGFTKTQPFLFTHLSNSDLVHGLRKKWPLGKYNPYLLFQ